MATPTYTCYVKGKTIKERYDGDIVPVYSLLIYLILRPEKAASETTKSFTFIEEIGILNDVDKYASETLITYVAMKKALEKILSLNMQGEDITIYVDDSKVGKQVCIQPSGKKQQKIIRRSDYDFVDTALEVIKLQDKFKNLKCFWIPKGGNNAEFLLNNPKKILSS